MSNDITQVACDVHLKIPNVFLFGELKELTSEAKVLYGLLKYIERQEIYNAPRFVDGQGYLFVAFRTANIARLLNSSPQTVLKRIRELEKFHLITVQWLRGKSIARVYIHYLPDYVSDETIDALCDAEEELAKEILKEE